MDEGKVTLGIYGIQDRLETTHPQYVHDHNLALINNGNIEFFAQLERITQQKRDNKLHHHLPSIIKEVKLVNKNMDVVFVDNIIGRAFIAANGQIRFEAPITNRLTKEAEKGKLWWFDREMDGYILNHELAHVFSCLPFYGEFEENSLLIHFDGGASHSNFSAWMYRLGKIIPVEHHWELKHLTSLFNANALTFGIIGAGIQHQNSVPGKLMGFAALGSYNEDIEFWLRQNHWFENIWGKRSQFFEKAKQDFNVDLKSFDQHNPFIQNVVATIQEVFVRETLMKLDDLKTITNCKNLYYTGGCALNIQANSAIVESGLFNNIYIPPCTEDSGLALGAAAYGEWKKGHSFKQHSAFLNNWGIESNQFNYSEEDINQVAQKLAEGKIIGVCNGFGEAGPRALGNRSLFALPTKELAQKVSVDCKQREWYRPVAPVMLEKNAKYFTGHNIHALSKYMLIDFRIKKELISEIEGVVHANGTARIQTLFEKKDNPFLFDLLTCLDEKHQIKAIINTSFNEQGKPIVHSQAHANEAFKSMGIDILVVNGKVQAV